MIGSDKQAKLSALVIDLRDLGPLNGVGDCIYRVSLRAEVFLVELVCRRKRTKSVDNSWLDAVVWTDEYEGQRRNNLTTRSVVCRVSASKSGQRLFTGNKVTCNCSPVTSFEAGRQRD